ncbi:copper resistance CopC family protein [Mangrovihabitans endophyticus]|uniref:CopC domain-containing protein n=1 Tax=Mangrovihabitans endophyticus TaxID=1751298 RepID=A0A8J3BZC5_9ACTN|nr:copper resistance CopC family protein [Mangrovihabitans endophyticus]GGK95781.1 hypothetical protein GCM10012284_32410 [Mangrovihabitans endophyticus]
MRRLLSASAAAAVVCAGTLAMPAPAQAHSSLLAATPGPGDKVAPGVSVVALTFHPLSGAGAPPRITVTGPDERAVPAGDTVLVNAATLCASVRPLTAGVHAIAYRATSADGDPVSGKFLFEVTPGGTTPDVPEPCAAAVLPSPGPAPAPAGSSQAGPAQAGPAQAGPAQAGRSMSGVTVLVAAVAGGTLLLAAGLGLALLRRRRRGDASATPPVRS